MADISKITLPDGVTYNIKDPKSLRESDVWDFDTQLQWGQRTGIFMIGNTTVHVELPPNPDTNTTYTVSTGSSNGTISVKPSNGNLYDVSVKGLGSAAYLTADTAASNNTVLKRTGNGYAYATYFNTTCGEANPSSYTNPRGLFVSSDGFIRRATAATFRTMIGAGTSSLTIGTTSSTAAAGNHNHSGTYEPAMSTTTTTTGNNGFNLRKRGNIVTIQANGVTADKRGTVPSGWRPPAVLWMGCVAFDGSKWYYGFIGINPNGTIDCKILNGTSIPAVTTSTYGFYLTGSWIL